VEFSLKNRLSGALLVGISSLMIGKKSIPIDRISLLLRGKKLSPGEISDKNPLPFEMGEKMEIKAKTEPIEEKGSCPISVLISTDPFGELNITVEDSIGTDEEPRSSVPYDKDDNYSDSIIRERKYYLKRNCEISPEHLFRYSIEPETTKGNIENFVGVSQVPVGLAGPVKVLGEHAQGDFLIPMSTTEGTLVASYNRGMKVINLSGGARVTITRDRMGRAPVFITESATGTRELDKWLWDHVEDLKMVARTTSSHCELEEVDRYQAGRHLYTRFCYTTGDAAGQNMVGKATMAICQWMAKNGPEIEDFYLESNFATDKKHSNVNTLMTRGKRVTAEVEIPHKVLKRVLRTTPDRMHAHHRVSNLGAFMSGVSNNGLHSANAIAAMFIACGQDVGNVAESSAGILDSQITDEGNLYLSMTIPSLIVGTVGGGTGLPTQRECLSILDCYGSGKSRKFAEIITAVALAGEISLAGAISSMEWVSSHEEYGRNRVVNEDP
jgi:hydroxymethylglutaryl-CoA reductase (NADPH)